MTIFDLYVRCDNIKAGACFYLYDKSLNYVTKVNPMAAREYAELDANGEDLTDMEVSAFEVDQDGMRVHVRIVV